MTRSRLVRLLAVLAAFLPVAAPAVDLGDGRVHLRAETWDAGTGPRTAALARRAEPSAWVVVHAPGADRQASDAILESRGRILGHVPSNAFLVWASPEGAAHLATAPGILRAEPYRDEWKISPELDRAGLGPDPRSRLFVELWPGEDPDAAADRVRSAGLGVVQVIRESGLHRLVVSATPETLPALAAVPAVQWIESLPHPTLRNDTVRWIIQSNVSLSVPLYDHGLLGQGEIIGHIDEPPDTTSCYFRDDVDNTIGPDHRKVVGLRRVNPPTTGTHGTHTAGTACGENVDPAFPQNRGMAPKARLSNSSYYDLHGVELDSTASNLATFFQAAHDDGARIHTNSWGDDTRLDYTSWCVDIDTFARQHEEDLVVFAATNLSTLRTPENAKNCLSVGATYSTPNQGTRSSGGVGPTQDGRRKPEVFAPGYGTRSSIPGACGTATLSGTSMAAPAVAGGAALVRQYFRRGFYPTGKAWSANARIPSGALLKAVMINSAVDMTGEFGYPSNTEGWGRILLDDALYFDGDARRLWVRDVRHARGLGTGRTDTFRFEVTSSAQPLKVTLAFMDQPAALGAGVIAVNDLDLEVQGPDGTFRGNVFDVVAGQSVTGGSPDALNDVERVVRLVPTPGDYTVRVRGSSVPLGPQGYAVAVNGALASRDYVTGPPLADSPAPDAGRRSAPAGDLGVERVTPNPFRTSMTVEFRMPAAGPLAVDVFDVRGRLVRRLLDSRVEAGDQRVTWDGRDDAGRRVGAGLYFVRLRSADSSRILKTALLQ